MAPPYTPRVDRIRLDGNVLWFTMGVSLLVAGLVGLAPALQAWSRRTGDTLKGGLGGSFAGIALRRPHRLRSALVVLEVLLAVIVVVGGALMGRSFYKLMSVSTGLDASYVLTMRVGFSDLIRKDWATKSPMAAEDVLDGIRSLPGVQRAVISDGGPFSGGLGIGHYPGSGRSGLYVEGRQGDQLPGDEWIFSNSVTQGYFAALGIRLLKGRDFEPGDMTSRVAIVSQGFVRKYISGNPLGKRFSISEDEDGQHSWMEIIGVVNDVRDRAVKEPSCPLFYRPFGSNSEGFEIIVQTSVKSHALDPGNNARGSIRGPGSANHAYRDGGSDPRQFRRRAKIPDGARGIVRRPRINSGDHRDLRCDLVFRRPADP